MVHTTAMLDSAATFLRKVIMRTADAESTPEVGSSRNRIEGCFTSASATDRRRFVEAPAQTTTGFKLKALLL